MITETRINGRLYNNDFKKAMTAVDIKTNKQLASMANVAPNVVGEYLWYQRRPITLDGNERTDIGRICKVLNVHVQDIFTKDCFKLNDIYDNSNRCECTDVDDMTDTSRRLIPYHMELRESINDLQYKIDTLPPRYAHIVSMYFGIINSANLTELAKEQNVGIERIRQIVNESLSRLRILYCTGVNVEPEMRTVMMDFIKF